MDDPAGEAWHRLLGVLEDCSGHLATGDFPVDDRGRAEGIRHLARQLTVALEGELEHADTRYPSLHRYELPWSQWGAPNPDNVYQRCAVDPSATYVLRGSATGVHEALFSVLEGDMHLGEDGVFDEVALTDLEVAADGAFELVISPDDGPGDRLRSTATTRLLLVRQYLWDWSAEPVMSLTIERPDTDGTRPDPPDGATIAAALDRAARWVERSIVHWAEYAAASRDLLEHNTFTPPRTPPGGAPSIAYGGGCWDLGPDEALVVEHDRPDAHYWNWSIHQLHWFDSGAWHRRPMSRNGHRAHVDDDGRVRVVIAGRDPGVPNWLDTEDRPLGMAVYRYVGATTRPVPEARVVPVDEVRAHLPAGHPVVGPEERRRELAGRSLSAQRRWS
jgi:hypothetical protein